MHHLGSVKSYKHNHSVPCTLCTHIYTRTHACSHTRTRAHAHTHIHILQPYQNSFYTFSPCNYGISVLVFASASELAVLLERTKSYFDGVLWSGTCGGACAVRCGGRVTQNWFYRVPLGYQVLLKLNSGRITHNSIQEKKKYSCDADSS